MKSNRLLAILIFVASYSAFSQQEAEGKVVAVLSIGINQYSIIHESGTENYYKTSPHAIGGLSQNQEVLLDFNENNLRQAELPVHFARNI